MFGLFKKRTKARLLVKDDLENISNQDASAIIMFGAAWCGACKMQKPIINDMADHHKNANTIIGLIDTDQEQELSQHFGITALPTIIVLKGKNVLFKKPGLMARRDLEKIFSEINKTPE